MTRMLFIAAGPQLLASLSEPFEALGGYRVAPLGGDIPTDMEPDAGVIIDGAFCDAADLARRLRDTGHSGKIIVIGAMAEAADVNLPRPFHLPTLLAELAKPHKVSNSDNYLQQGLTEKETAILARLLHAEGEIVARDALLADVWGYAPNVTTRTLETHIHRLRQNIEEDPRNPRKLLTEEGGYRFTKSTT